MVYARVVGADSMPHAAHRQHCVVVRREQVGQRVPDNGHDNRQHAPADCRIPRERREQRIKARPRAGRAWRRSHLPA
jgi:hypothetical protein